MANKRIIEQTASTTISNDDWLIKDSPTDGTTKIQASVFKTLMNEGMASDEDLADAIENIAGEYDSEVEYSKDALCLKDGVLYIANADTTRTWDSTKWDATTIADIIANLRIDANDVVDVKVKGDSLVNSSKIAVLDSLTAQGSASGSIASFSDGSTYPMSKLEVAINPIQDLNGYDHPWAGGAGKNKLEVTRKSSTDHGITFNVNQDGTIAVSGTYESQTNFLINPSCYLKAGNYILNGVPSDPSWITFQMYIVANGNKYASVTGTQFTIDEDGEYPVYISIYGELSGTLIFKPMIRLATETDATFEPYSNICPISGFTEANVMRCGVNVWDGLTEIGSISTTTGENTPSYNQSYRRSDYIKIDATKTYYCYSQNNMQLVAYEYDENYNYIGFDVKTNVEYTPSSNCAYIRLRFDVDSGDQNPVVASINYPSTATAYEPYNGNTYNVEFKDGDNPLTVYGGTLDVVSGVLVVTHGYVDMGSLVWGGSPSNYAHTSLNPTKAKGVTNVIADCYETVDVASVSSMTNGNIKGNEGNTAVYVKDERFTTPSDLKTALSGHYLCYELATPQTYQLTPTQVNSLLGTNNVWADTGDVNEAVYTRDLNTTVNDIISRIEALENA